ncbi:MAG: hypothetical protein IKP61_10285 [Spirochaetales bacterium]|nr:hypothetical protein [Spirochaetales bacterium]
MAEESFVYYCRCCGRILFGPQEIEDKDRKCPNCGEQTDLTDLTEEKWNAMSLKTREWQIDLWKNKMEFDDSISEEYEEDAEGGEESFYSPDYVEQEKDDDLLSDYYSVVWDWETNPPEEDGEYIIWFIRKDKDPSCRKLSFKGGLWLDAKGEAIDLEKYRPAFWMKLPTFSDEVIEYYRNR